MIDERTARVRPTPGQLSWQQAGTGAFFHVGPSTFNGQEWSDGTDSPALFAPAGLDTDHWLACAASFGARYAVLTAKHHDGFCLWPTATTTYSVAASPWRRGTADVVAEFAASCRRFGIGFGVYLSPWDRNSPAYHDREAYDDLYCAQLTELLTGYGDVAEIWFDGAGSEGRDYDWARIGAVCRRLQPGAMRFHLGDATISWIGNEDGLAADPVEYVVETVDGLRYRPPECDVSLRDGWFHHDDETPKSLAQCLTIRDHSVGLGAGLLLNVPPAATGLIDPADVVRCAEYGRAVRDEAARTVPLTLTRRGPDTWRATAPAGRAVTAVVLGDDLRDGQRVHHHRVSADGVVVADAGTVGVRRVHRWATPCEVSRIDVEVASAGPPRLSLAAVLA